MNGQRSPSLAPSGFSNPSSTFSSQIARLETSNSHHLPSPGSPTPTLTSHRTSFSVINEPLPLAKQPLVYWSDRRFWATDIRRDIRADNSWRRESAWQRPFHISFLTILLMFIYSYCVFFSTTSFFVEPLIGIPNLVGWIVFGLAGVSMAGMVLYVTLVEVEASEVRQAGKARNLDFVKTVGVHVIDNGVCGICCVSVPVRTRHCKSCNKCVADFDHHCPYLNTCIAGRNYQGFLVLLSTTVWVSALSMLLSFRVFVALFTERDLFIRTLSSTWHTFGDENSLWVLAGVLICFEGVIALLVFVMSTALAIFHAYLRVLGMTTFEYNTGVRSTSRLQFLDFRRRSSS
ncbi:hypothetical protein M427DRAFT_150949 [Gonapodya prolifera JEL478]|uniref:Palmitoyltransferase n=1 Tax=Gonapodya prolifera (strain JEL478) TaxID=1344416 RepID=A0A139AY40_GONPJ|nr:hypothetical protein M427DRAFT_150949 [Gonapodya prolifera JEL478]|eukprot:KXS21617.1 hypothetical protein M427DRAFT_150949 [Gonapodya prolifera JEL478]